ncbi:hypothetical protein B296_00005469 [Ensete ventricosum]|uniref:Uncharacterized protein n=1 Tax=Ensete ventricosum TaxID=4639 RepID=A0A427AIG8_ENSVE|nr:hypothetical protein B296_00005469 [Ensete ventricosum]
MIETYGGRAAAAAWGGGMGRHAALMGMGHATSCSGTSTSDSRSDTDLVPRADVISSEVFDKSCLPPNKELKTKWFTSLPFTNPTSPPLPLLEKRAAKKAMAEESQRACESRLGDAHHHHHLPHYFPLVINRSLVSTSRQVRDRCMDLFASEVCEEELGAVWVSEGLMEKGRWEDVNKSLQSAHNGRGRLGLQVHPLTVDSVLIL